MSDKRFRISPEQVIKLGMFFSSQEDAQRFVMALTYLGIVEPETQESIHAQGCEFISNMAERWQTRTARAVHDDLDKAGYRIVRK